MARDSAVYIEFFNKKFKMLDRYVAEDARAIAALLQERIALVRSKYSLKSDVQTLLEASFSVLQDYARREKYYRLLTEEVKQRLLDLREQLAKDAKP